MVRVSINTKLLVLHFIHLYSVDSATGPNSARIRSPRATGTSNRIQSLPFAVGLRIKQIISGNMISKASVESTFNGFGDERQVGDRTTVGQLFLVKLFLSKGNIHCVSKKVPTFELS